MKQQLYITVWLACAAGYGWLYLNANQTPETVHTIGFCPVKYVTSVPCPSCGSTRSVLQLLDGHFLDALLLNPFGYLILFLMLVLPLWILADVVLRRSSLFHVYTLIESTLTQTRYAIPLSALVVLNWIWNITKGL